MKKRILLLLYYFFCVIIINAQSSFVKALGGSGNDVANFAIETLDGNYLVIGSTSSFGSGGTDGYVSKVNGSVKEIWDRAIGGINDDVFQHGIQLSNEDFVLVGWTSSFGSGGEDLLVVRMDKFGSIIWTKTFGGDKDDRGYAVHETSDGKILIAGYTKSFGQGGIDVFVIKIDLDGSEIWSKSFGTVGNDWFSGQGLIEDLEGNYLLSGFWWRGNNGSTPHDGFFMKLNPDGDVLLVKGYGADNNEGMSGLLKETTSGYQNIGIGWSWNGPNHEIWMSDFDESGNLNWSKTFGFVNENIRIGAIYFTDDENYLISGFEHREHINAIGKAILLKVSQSGDVLWSKMYGDIGIETLDVVFETNSGILAFGKTTTYGEGGNDVFIVGADEFGTVSGCSENIYLTINDVTPEATIPPFVVEGLSVGAFQTLMTSNVDFDETLVCDGCDATDLEAGLFCETAPIICSIDCLDGFTGTLPSELIMPQPEPLCDGGIPNNLSWFAFVAGSSTIDLSIIPTNCTTIFNEDGTSAQTIGIQAGVYEDCNFETSFICQSDGCLDLIAETINLSSTEFVEGQIYYLFVDGCGGSICDYEVVVNSAKQAFEMDEITTISNNLNFNVEEDTICQGAAITFSLDSFDMQANFSWSIDPPTSDYPSGAHSVTDTSAVTFQFSEEGCFDIHVYAYNECDNSETQTFTVCVQSLEDEVFSDIYVCQECFPITLISPESGCIITEGGGAPTVLIEDPNGDGVSGWLGISTISGPGIDSNIVVNTLGCSYTQFVNVVEIPLSPREQVDYYFCLMDFPVDINGTIFNSPGDTKNITLNGAAASGCDSLMSITAKAVDFFGFPSVGNCDVGQVALAIVLENVPLDSYDSITYIWYDEFGDIVVDGNGIDSIIVVTGIGSYSVQVEVVVEGVSCSQSFGPFMIDVDNLAPEIPNITYAPIEICASELQTQIYVANQSLGENYIWTFTPSMPFSFGLTSDTVYIDITNGQDFEFCIHAVNGCGFSEDICDMVLVKESPDSEFMFDSEICLDSFIIIEYTGEFGGSTSSVFNWNFGGGSVLNGIDVNSAGPFEVGFSNVGQYTIGLTLEEFGCTSILTEHLVTVAEPIDPPMVECESGSGIVVFSWDETDVDEVAVTVLTGQSSIELINNTFEVNGLGSEEEVTIQIEFNAGGVCDGVIIIENCSSSPCPDVDLDIILSAQNLCLTDDLEVVLNVVVGGDTSGEGNWSSSFIYNDSLFDVSEAGIGEHNISYLYVIDDCTYSADTLLYVFKNPEVNIDIFPSYCVEMGSNLIDIITFEENTVLLDSMVINDFDVIEISIGEHVLNVTNSGGCSTELDFNIEDFVLENLSIDGDSVVIQGDSEIYAAIFNSNIEDLVLIWTVDGDTICMGCDQVTINPEEDIELCLFVKYGYDGCVLTDCFTIEVRSRTKLMIPNIFSPNNDKINDQFAIISNEQDVFINEIMIFDRWGEMVYNQKGFNVSEESRFWDGTLNGKLCETGVYVYIVNYLDEENQEKKLFGDITLVR